MLSTTLLLCPPQDIEGVFSRGEYYVVQSRPQILRKH